MTRRRLFVVPTRGDLPIRDAVDHWEQRHGAVFAATPDLDGYVQHRPTSAEQQRLGGRVCAEAWFSDPQAEVRAFGSAHYRGAVTEDEERFVDRSRAWVAIVREESPTGPPAADIGGGLEVVAVGCDPASVPPEVPARLLVLDRPGPSGGPAVAVLAAVADEGAGRLLAEQLVADVAFVARPHAVKPPVARA